MADFLQEVTSKKDQQVRHGSGLVPIISRGVENFRNVRLYSRSDGGGIPPGVDLQEGPVGETRLETSFENL